MNEINSAPNETSAHQSGLVIPVTLLFIASLIMMAMFQSAALVTLTYDLPPHALSEIAVQWAEKWHGAMESLGTASLSENLQNAVENIRTQTIAP